MQRSTWDAHTIKAAVIAPLFFLVGSTLSHDHIVGDSLWSIPPTNDFYANWARNSSFLVGDTLVFRFEMGFYNVVQVSRREFEDCKDENPFRTFLVGPALVGLQEEGVCYFICSFGNYCSLGLKLSVSVQNPQPQANSSSSPAPSPVMDDGIEW